MYNLKQEYDNYTTEDFLVWKLIYQRQNVLLQSMASKVFIEGMEEMHFNAEKIPEYNHVNNVLANTTGWQIEVVPG